MIIRGETNCSMHRVFDSISTYPGSPSLSNGRGGNGNLKPSKNVIFSARDLTLCYDDDGDIDGMGC